MVGAESAVSALGEAVAAQVSLVRNPPVRTCLRSDNGRKMNRKERREFWGELASFSVGAFSGMFLRGMRARGRGAQVVAWGDLFILVGAAVGRGFSGYGLI